MRSDKKLSRGFVAILLASLFALLVSVPVFHAQNDPTTTITKLVYVGTPLGTVANYTEEYRVFVIFNNSVIAYTGYNMSFSVQVSGLSQKDFLGNYYQVNLLISINKVSVLPNYAKLKALVKPLPVAGTTVSGSELTGNFSVRPFFIISPNAPNKSQIIGGVNFTVYRVSSYQYSQGSIHFNAPAIIMLTQYSPLASTQISGKYVYDAKSGLLLYSTNTTVYNTTVNNLPAQLKYTTQVWLIGTNLASINPSGSEQPITPNTVIVTHSYSVLTTAFIVIMVVMVVVIALLLVFGRRR